MKFIVYLLLIVLLLNVAPACFAQGGTKVVVLPVRMSAPRGAKKVGSFTIGNNATKTRCDYEALVNEAKDKARAMGGNLVKITELAAPAFVGKCYKIKADVYVVADLSQYDVHTTEQPLANGHDYATLYLYRLKDTLALEPAYNVHLGEDSVIYRTKSRSRDSVMLTAGDTITLWAKTDKRTELTLEVKAGARYYIRCGLKHGELIMTPVIEVVNNTTGEAEYKSLKKSKKDMGVQYLQQIH